VSTVYLLKEVKRELKRIHIDGCRCNERLNGKTELRRDLNASHTLGCVGRNNSNPSSGSSGHAGDTRPGQKRKKPEDLSAREVRRWTFHKRIVRNMTS